MVKDNRSTIDRSVVFLRGLYLAIEQKNAFEPIFKDDKLAKSLMFAQVMQCLDVVFAFLRFTNTFWLLSLIQILSRVIIIFGTLCIHPDVIRKFSFLVQMCCSANSCMVSCRCYQIFVLLLHNKQTTLYDKMATLHSIHYIISYWLLLRAFLCVGSKTRLYAV